MNRCPITYEPLKGDEHYSKEGLKKLSRHLSDLKPIPLTAKEQRMEAAIRAEKMSIQGVQPKLSAILNIKEASFEIVDRNGKYILKPQCEYDELPENEALTMSLADMAGIEIPVHGLLYSKDNSFTYFIRRFDRTGRKDKVHVEDFAQLSGESRETKYDSSMEKVAKVIASICTFPVVENAKFFRRTLFSYLIGNEDMHLKNFSLILRDGKVELSPAYDLVNSTIVLPRASEELALPLGGKKSNLKREDLIDYFGIKRLGLNMRTIDEILAKFSSVIPEWKILIANSFLSKKMAEKYLGVLEERRHRLGV